MDSPLVFDIMYIDIKRIMNAVKVEDGHIILNKPYECIKYGKKFKIDQVNYFYKWEKLVSFLGAFLVYYNNVCRTLKLPDSLDDLEQFGKNLNLTLKNAQWGKYAFKKLIKTCKLGNETPIRIRWMKKKFKKDDWIEMFGYVYIYNVLGVKKNLSNMLKVMKKVVSS